MSDQLDLDNPVERHPTISPPEQDQDFTVPTSVSSPAPTSA